MKTTFKILKYIKKQVVVEAIQWDGTLEKALEISQIEGLNHINNVLDIHLWSLDGIDSILTLKINIDDVNNGDEVKKEIYTIASKYHIVDTTVEFR